MARQQGLPSTPARRGRTKANGLMVRGVVVNSYFADADDSGQATARDSFQGVRVTAVSVDVLTYGGRYRYFLERVPVMQRHHGLNDYSGIWIPRPSNVDLAKGSLGLPNGITPAADISDPADFDGDHVMVAFMEDDPTQPVVIGELPHPRATYRHDSSFGEQIRSRFRGVETRIDSVGGVTLDAIRANDGSIDADGNETPADDPFFGNLSILLNKTAELSVQGRPSDLSSIAYEMTLKDGLASLGLGDGTEINVKPGEVNLGSAAAADFVALSTKVLSELASIVSQVNALVVAHNAVVAKLEVDALATPPGVVKPGYGALVALPVTSPSSVAASKVKAD